MLEKTEKDCYNKKKGLWCRMDILIVVDMQNDFVSGALGTQEAVDIVPYVVGRVVDGINRGEEILFTRDTHTQD